MQMSQSGRPDGAHRTTKKQQDPLVLNPPSTLGFAVLAAERTMGDNGTVVNRSAEQRSVSTTLGYSSRVEAGDRAR